MTVATDNIVLLILEIVWIIVGIVWIVKAIR